MQGVDGHVVQGCEKVLALLSSVKMTYEAQLLPRQVGVHPDNRDGYGLNSEDVHGLGQDIFRMGWAWDQVAGAICVEEAPNSKVFEEFNKALADGSSKLAPVDADAVKYASLSCSHTNAFLRALAAGVSSDCEAMSESGKFCLRKVESHDPDLALAATKGLTWLVLTHEVATRFPALAGLIQQARNAPGHVARLESEVQVMLTMQRMASAEQRQTKASADYERIQKMVMRSKPPCYADGPELMQFVVMCSGGMEGGVVAGLGSVPQRVRQRGSTDHPRRVLPASRDVVGPSRLATPENCDHQGAVHVPTEQGRQEGVRVDYAGGSAKCSQEALERPGGS